MPRKWSRQHEERLQRLLALMSREAQPFGDTSREAVAARRGQPFATWCRTYLPHWFSVADAPFHADADARRDNCGAPMCECWAGGTGKTTRYVIADCLYTVANTLHLYTDEVTGERFYATSAPDALTRGHRLVFVVLGARTETAAAEKIDIIRQELRHNARLRADYGDALEPRDGNDEQTDVVANGVRLLARGIGQSLRGQVFAGRRPQKFVGDDLEDQAIARSREREAKLYEWLTEDAYPRLEGVGSEAVCRLLCNMYGRLCLAVRMKSLADQADATGKPLAVYHSYPLLDADGQSTWPARYTTDQVKRAMAVVGARAARTQYLCLTADDEAPYQPEWMRAYDLRALAPEQIAAMRKAAYLDPSATAKETSDYKALVVLGAMPGAPEVYCLHAWIRRSTPDEMIRELLRVADQFPGVSLAGERNGFQSLLWNLLVLTCEREGRPVPYVRGVLNTANKLDRLLTWQAEFQLGRCLFDPREGDQQRLIDQFCDLPSGSHDDGPDAWDGARRILGRLTGKGNAPDAAANYSRADALHDIGVDHWLSPDNPAIWEAVDA